MAARKPAARKTTAKKSTARKSAARKPAARAAAKRPAAKKTAAKKTARTTQAATKKAAGADAMVARLEAFGARNWQKEPGDIQRLRKHKLPPMGNMPGVFYANFNTFWLGENIQVVRQLAVERAMPVGQLNAMAAALLNRHAGRLAKWKLTNTVKLVRELADFFEGGGPKSHAQVVRVCEATMVSMDRVNAWIDAMIPWSQLDKSLKLSKAAG
jgi:hypothetical protein